MTTSGSASPRATATSRARSRGVTPRPRAVVPGRTPSRRRPRAVVPGRVPSRPPQRTRQTGRAAVALQRQVRAVVGVDLDAPPLELAPHARGAVADDHDARPHGEDVAPHGEVV